MQALVGILAAILGIAGGLITWWINNNPRIRARKLLDKIERLDDELREAVAERDMARIAELNLELDRLRVAQESLNRL
jgi:hypothetical protein